MTKELLFVNSMNKDALILPDHLKNSPSISIAQIIEEQSNSDEGKVFKLVLGIGIFLLLVILGIVLYDYCKHMRRAGLFRHHSTNSRKEMARFRRGRRFNVISIATNQRETHWRVGNHVIDESDSVNSDFGPFRKQSEEKNNNQQFQFQKQSEEKSDFESLSCQLDKMDSLPIEATKTTNSSVDVVKRSRLSLPAPDFGRQRSYTNEEARSEKLVRSDGDLSYKDRDCVSTPSMIDIFKLKYDLFLSAQEKRRQRAKILYERRLTMARFEGTPPPEYPEILQKKISTDSNDRQQDKSKAGLLVFSLRVPMSQRH